MWFVFYFCETFPAQDLDQGKVQLQGFSQRPTALLPQGPLARLHRKLNSLSRAVEVGVLSTASSSKSCQQLEHDVTIAFASFMAQVLCKIDLLQVHLLRSKVH